MNKQASISIDQVKAFVELARLGSLRLAARALHLSEEGLRGRLLLLEDRLGVTLYEKERGRRTGVNLTHAGKIFHGKALRFLEQARTVTELFESPQPNQEIRIAVSYYMANLYLSNILKRFHLEFPHVTVQVTTGTEQQIISAMQADESIKAGICVCDEFPKNLHYQKLLSMSWCFVAPLVHPFLKESNVSLEQLAREPLIMFEPPCSGRQRILEAFYAKKIAPNVVIEVSTTQMILNLIEDGIGTAIIPALKPNSIVRDRPIGQVAISDAIRPVEFGILSRADLCESDMCRVLVNFVLAEFEHEHRTNQTPDLGRAPLNIIANKSSLQPSIATHLRRVK